MLGYLATVPHDHLTQWANKFYRVFLKPIHKLYWSTMLHAYISLRLKYKLKVIS